MDNKYNSGWKEVRNKLLGDCAVVESVNGNYMTVSRYKINKEMNISSHSHEYEQSIYVLEGEMNLVLDNKRITMIAGDIQIILSNVEHSAEITGIPFQSIESYYPIRSDLIGLSDKEE